MKGIAEKRMVATIKHHVDIGDDMQGILCHCTCGWRFKSKIRQERLSESYYHIGQSIKNDLEDKNVGST